MSQLRTSRRAFLAGLALTSTAGTFAIARGREKITFGTSWIAQAEQGGYYQAIADGTYADHGLDVSIIPGGPQSNNHMMFTAGHIDFYMGTNLLQAFAAVEQNIPTVVLAAMFQKDPQVLIAHPEPDIRTFLDLAKLPTIFVSSEGQASYYRWLKMDFGFQDAQVRRYTFNPQPFIADKRSAMQGYVTSEPYSIEKAANFIPKVFLLADQGYDTYANTIQAHRKSLANRPETCRRFVEASIIGWYNYLYGDNAAANKLIKKSNPEITDAAIFYAVARMKEYGIVESETSAALGIGSLTEATVRSFFDKMVRAGVQNPNIDWRRSFDARFVNKGFGKELRKAG